MKYRIKKDILWRAVSGEVIIVNSNTGENCYLNSTGSEIWQMINKGLDFDRICEKLAGVYNVTNDEIAKDIKNIVDDLVKSKILEKN
jgi:hypothetical protein